MEEPSPRSSRLVLATAVAATLLIGGAGFLLGRSTSERPPTTVPAPPPLAPVAEAPPPPAQVSLLGRGELIALANAAADAAAAGQPVPAAVAEADGRRFEMDLPFGCNGPAADNGGGDMYWRYDPEEETLRIHVQPRSWRPEEWWEAPAAEVERVEGFWISRPWTSNSDCPRASRAAAAAGIEPVTLPGQTLALGQVFSADSARTSSREGAPFTTSVRMSEDSLAAGHGFRLRLSGRIAALPSAGPVHCRQPAGPEQRPICLVTVMLEQVSVRNPRTEAILATWDMAGRRPATTP